MANLGYIQITRICNQNCRFCSNPPNERVMPLEEVKATLDEFKAQGQDGVILTGGEPTLHPDLSAIVAHARRIGLESRIITNGQKLSDPRYFASLVESGLAHVHLSIHSCKPEVQGYLTENGESFAHIVAALRLCGESGLTVNVNTVINKYNADHLHETVRWLTGEYPFIRHFVWNNLDPLMNRVSKHPDVVPALRDFEIPLALAAGLLKKLGKTFRIERVPLCYMAEHAASSTETRKIVKGEGRTILFLDERGKHSQDSFYYEKAPRCEPCSLREICAGLYCGDKYYSFGELFPVFIDKEKIVSVIRDSE